MTMQRMVRAMLFHVCLFAAVLCLSAQEKLPKPIEFKSDTFRIVIHPIGHHTIYAGGSPLMMLWPWPLKTSEGTAPITDIKGTVEDIEQGKVIKVSVATADYKMEKTVRCLPKKMEIGYCVEILKDMPADALKLGYFMHARFIMDRDYEWGPEIGVPEERGVFSPKTPKIGSSPGYFRIYNFNDSVDVTITFPSSNRVDIVPQQWHRWSQNEDRNNPLLDFRIYPEWTEKNDVIKAGTKGTASIVFDFTVSE